MDGVDGPDPVITADDIAFGRVTVSEAIGAKQSPQMDTMDDRPTPPDVDERMDRLPFGGLLRAARAMGHGMERGYETEDGAYAHWRTQPASYHLNRALRHIALWQMGDTSEEHVGHAASRMLMWAALVEDAE